MAQVVATVSFRPDDVVDENKIRVGRGVMVKAGDEFKDTDPVVKANKDCFKPKPKGK